ncbi:peptidase [Priestia megaterium]|uniref:Peptidase n=1 Tax=Priestia megaterium TaxID=1404 RepID=A0A6H1PCQ1_PRIMG|nr:peptidase [Priestia megaterium]
MKKMFIILSLAIMLTATGNSIHKVQAQSLTDIQIQKQLPRVILSTTQLNLSTADQEIQNPQGNIKIINNELKRVSKTIQANNQEIKKIQMDSLRIKTEVKQLEKEILILEKDMDKRKSLLRDQARSYQQSDKHITYLDVLLGATSLSNFVDRVGAIAAIAEADRDLLVQQETQQHQYTNKKISLEKKITTHADMKNKLETLSANLKNQAKEYKMLRVAQKKEKEKEQTYINVASENVGEYISTVINAGNKYIGNSVYVFGGGKNAYDVAHGRFDCSGFVHWAFAQAGIEIGRTTSSIKNDGRHISPPKLQPGDLVFFDTYKKDGHVGIYLGNGKFIGSQSSTGVAIADMTKGYWKNAFKGRVIRI